MKIGITFSGGGARGFAHLGAVQALHEAGIRPSIISGASAGAIVGAFLAAGYLPKRTMEIIADINFLKYFRPIIIGSGFVKLEKISDLLLNYFPENNFESLELPFTISTTNYTQGKVAYFSEGELIRPLLASASIPVIFEPITIGEDLYVDGGVLCNMPAQVIREQADYLFGINCNPIAKHAMARGTKDTLERTMLMAIGCNTSEQKQYVDFFIEPQQLDQYKVFALSKAHEIFDIGYEYTKNMLAQQKPGFIKSAGKAKSKSSEI
ncbi:phospholipase [Marivirga lumbricoides]|uniref:Phospholipase n=1 Tax=Marivirga lumbricoides TaxID=1046115 RepID=A0ABQ1M6T5_9BACT|nr:phospholipase [Marivirga lumbricoides]